AGRGATRSRRGRALLHNARPLLLGISRQQRQLQPFAVAPRLNVIAMSNNHGGRMNLPRIACILFLLSAATTARAVEIDGHIDPVEWQEARYITDFRKTQPLTR